ncbi:MXAN_6230/SCO0854 family RING domain-containing protein [Actinoplanes sp. NPDC049599]|uniref:MXAN_6230/SCO0854 family RING domain-containing protein n=1 Tax=Actinoplanes sp. NPDC049599 TaxID=3363903 RepID=UPI0037B819B9
MDPLAVVLLRRTAKVVAGPSGDELHDGTAWVGALEADLVERGRLLHRDLRAAAARMPRTSRTRWADWLLAALDEQVGADREMVPLYRSFPDTPQHTEAVYIRRLLTHLLAVPGAPCVLCGREQDGEPLDPCGHPVCRVCFAPEEFSACPICGRRAAAGGGYLPVVAPAGKPPAGPPIQVRLLRLETDPRGAAVRLRDELVARPAALGEADRADLAVLVRSTAPAALDWLPETVPARETLAVVVAWALHATALTEAYPQVVAEARRRWQTATDAGRTLWAYSGGDPGLILPARTDAPGSRAVPVAPVVPVAPGSRAAPVVPVVPVAPGEAWRPVDEPATSVPVPRVRALPRALRRAVLEHLDACGAGTAAEDLRRHPAVWKRLGERLHPFERADRHPGATVAFAVLRGTRVARDSALGAAMVAACAEDPRRLVPVDHPDGTVSVRLRTHASLVERAFADGDAGLAARLLAERPGELWRRVDQLLRSTVPGDRAGLVAVLRESAGRVAPGVLAAAAAELVGREATVAATPAQLAAMAEARAAGVARARGGAASAAPVRAAAAENGVGRAASASAAPVRAAAAEGGVGRAVRASAAPVRAAAAEGGVGRAARAVFDAIIGLARRPDPTAARPSGPDAVPGAAVSDGDAVDPAGAGVVAAGAAAAGIIAGRPGPGMPRRVFFPRGSAVITWTEPERREPLDAVAIGAVRGIVDGELTRRAARLGRFDVAVLDATLADVPAPMRERAGSAQFAGWPRGSIRALPGVPELRLFLHWQDTDDSRVDLDLSCVFFDDAWQRLGECDYTVLRFGDDGAVHSGDLTSAPGPLGATEFLDLRLDRLAELGVRYAVPAVLSYNAVPFELLTEAFAGIVLPVAGGAQFDAGRVEQRFDLRGDARVLMPMVVDLAERSLLWTDLALPGHGYGHSVGRHGDQLARAAADLWEHFGAGNRATVLDLMAWQAAGRADRVLVAHGDGTCTEAAPTVAAIRAAAGAGTGKLAAVDGVDGRTVLAATADAAALDRLIPGPVAADSVALTVTGHPGEHWTQLHAADALGELAVPQ